MDITGKDCILAIVARDEDRVVPGGCPLFLVRTAEEQERVALLLARVIGAMVHDLENGVWILVRH